MKIYKRLLLLCITVCMILQSCMVSAKIEDITVRDNDYDCCVIVIVETIWFECNYSYDPGGQFINQLTKKKVDGKDDCGYRRQ